MSKLVIGYKNLAPSVTVAASGSDAAFPVTNVQENDPALAWHSSGTTAYLQADYNTADPATTELVGMVVAVGTNLTSEGTRRVRLSGNSDMSSPAYDSGVDQAFDDTYDNPLEFHGPFGSDVIHLAPGGFYAAVRYLRMDLEESGNPDGFIRVGLWWMGPIWAPATGKGFTWRDDTEYIAGKARRKFALSWRHLPRTEAAVFKSILHKLAQTGRVYMVLQDEDIPRWHLEAMLCTIGQVQETPVDDYVQLSCVATEADY